MKKLTLILAVATLFLITSVAQAQKLIWEKVMQQPMLSKAEYAPSYRGNTVTTDKQNNIYLGGEFSPNNWQSDLTCLSKFSPMGNLLWEYAYPFHFYKFNELEGVANYFWGNYVYFNKKDELCFVGSVATATTTNFRDTLYIAIAGDYGETSNNKHNTKTGELEHEGYIHQPNYSDEPPFDYGFLFVFHQEAIELRDGRVAVADYSDLALTDDRGVKTAPQQKYISDLNEKSIHSLEQTKDGGIVLLYTVHSGSKYNWGINVVFKTDSNGKTIWSKILKKNVPRGSAAAREMPNGDIAVMGYYANKDSLGKFYQDAELTMLSKDGDSLWTKTYKSKNKSAIKTQEMRVTKDGGLIVCGAEVNFAQNSTASNYENDWDIWLMKLDKNGNEQWQTSRVNLDSFDFANDVHVDKNGDYVVTGYLNWVSMYLAKFSDSTITSVNEEEEIGEPSLIISKEQNSLELKIGNRAMQNFSNVRLSNVLGRDLEVRGEAESGGIIYDISSLNSGLYFLTWKEKGISKSKKFVLQR